MKRKTKKPRKKNTDNNVNNLYRLENDELPQGATFSTIQNAQSYVDFVTASHFWKDCGKYERPESIKVYDWGDSVTSEARDPHEIWLARRHWTQQSVLHELSHFLAPEGHGPKFVRAYLSVIAHFMGLELSRRYARAFKRGGIKL